MRCCGAILSRVHNKCGSSCDRHKEGHSDVKECDTGSNEVVPSCSQNDSCTEHNRRCIEKRCDHSSKQSTCSSCVARGRDCHSNGSRSYGEGVLTTLRRRLSRLAARVDSVSGSTRYQRRHSLIGECMRGLHSVLWGRGDNERMIGEGLLWYGYTTKDADGAIIFSVFILVLLPLV